MMPSWQIDETVLVWLRLSGYVALFILFPFTALVMVRSREDEPMLTTGGGDDGRLGPELVDLNSGSSSLTSLGVSGQILSLRRMLVSELDILRDDFISGGRRQVGVETLRVWIRYDEAMRAMALARAQDGKSSKRSDVSASASLFEDWLSRQPAEVRGLLNQRLRALLVQSQLLPLE